MNPTAEKAYQQQCLKEWENTHESLVHKIYSLEHEIIQLNHQNERAVREIDAFRKALDK